MVELSDQKRAYLLGGTTVLFWSTVATAFKLALIELSVSQLVFYASLTASLILFCYLALTRRLSHLLPAFQQHWRLTLIAAALNPFLYYLILLEAYDRLPAQVAQPINYTWAITLTLLSVVILKQRLKWTDVVATPICYLGVLVISLQGQWNFAESADLTGIALALLSTLLWASYWILNIRDPRDPAVALCLNFSMAVPMTALFCVVQGDNFIVSLNGLMAALYVGCFEMGLAFICWSAALRYAENTSRVSNLIFLSPFLSLILISQILGEPIYSTTYVGLILILGGLAIQQSKREQADGS